MVPSYPPLSTTRLSLRRPQSRDAAAIAQIVGKWDVARRLARVPHPYSLDDAAYFLERVVPNEWVWAITLTGCDDFIGVMGLTPGQQGERAELGYWLGAEHWGLGIATEAGHAVLSFGFDHLHLATVTSAYFEDNPASGRVLVKLGFTETARALRPCLAIGFDVPSVEMHLPRAATGR